MKILFASNNPGKVKEVRELVKDLLLEIVTPSEVFPNGFEVEETGTTFAENAILKAKAMGDQSNLITIADDSGLVVDVLNGEPGVYSARYESTDEKRNQKILTNLQGVPPAKRTARFAAVICVYDPRTKSHQTFTGSVEGTITEKLMGEGGFGYDPIFYATELGKTFGEATMAEKNRISHRHRALLLAKPLLEELAKKY